MSFDLQSAVQQSTAAAGTNQLVGDLTTLPNPMFALVDQDIYALEWAIPYAGADRTVLEQMVAERKVELAAELRRADPILTRLLQTRVNHQLRSRHSFERDCIAIEQWIPALRCWLTNGYYPHGTPYSKIVDDLERGDPRKKTAEEELADRRSAAARVQKSNDDAHTLRVMDAVADLGPARIERFVDVERAFHTGETITCRGDDRRKVEKLYEDTRTAAHKGDVESQNVLTHGQQDNQTCLLPSTNPLRHRHRSEREREASSGK